MAHGRRHAASLLRAETPATKAGTADVKEPQEAGAATKNNATDEEEAAVKNATEAEKRLAAKREAEAKAKSAEVLKEEEAKVKQAESDAELVKKRTMAREEAKNKIEDQLRLACNIGISAVSWCILGLILHCCLEQARAKERKKTTEVLDTKIEEVKKEIAIKLRDKDLQEQLDKAKADRGGEHDEGMAAAIAIRDAEKAEKQRLAAEREAAYQLNTGPRAPVEGAKIRLSVSIGQATGVPEVNTLGGVDPYLIVRLMKKNPNDMKDAGLLQKELQKARTQVQKGSTPKFDEKFVFDMEYRANSYIQLVLYDSGATDTPLGHIPLQLERAMRDCKFVASGRPESTKHWARCKPISAAQPFNVTDTKVGFKLSFNEMHKWDVVVMGIEGVPPLPELDNKVKVQVRIMPWDITTAAFSPSVPEDCIVKFDTKSKPLAYQTMWNSTFEAEEVEASRSNSFHIIVFNVADASNPLAICHATLPLSKYTIAPPKDLQDCELPLYAIRGQPQSEAIAQQMKGAKLYLRVAYMLA